MLNLKRSLQTDDVFDPDYLCWCFDNACEWVSGYVQGKLMKADDAQAELEHLLMPVEKPSMSDTLTLLRMKLNAAVASDGTERAR